MTAFQQNLEKLKSECLSAHQFCNGPTNCLPNVLKGKKRGEVVLDSSSSAAEQSESSAGVPFKGARPHHSGESDASHDETDSGSEEDEGFIVDDDTHGVPATQLPLAFSLSTHQDLTCHFKIVCQLFVHLAVRPLVDRRPFLERALKGLTI